MARAIGAEIALHRRTRSAGASSSWRPRRPADTKTEACSQREHVDNDRQRPPHAERADPTDDVAGRTLGRGRIGEGGPRPPDASARRFRSSSRSTGTTARTSGPSTSATSVLKTRPGRGQGPRPRRPVVRAAVAVAAVALGRGVGVNPMDDPGSKRVDGAGAAAVTVRSYPFRLCSGGPSPSASIDARRAAAVALRAVPAAGRHSGATA